MRFELNSQSELQRGLTRLEVVVLVGTTAIFAMILLPAMATTHQQDRSSVCVNNLRQIWLGMMNYAADNDGYLYSRSDGNVPEVPNNGRWTANPRATNMLGPEDLMAYWGVAYFDYIGRTREVFRCPSARIVDQWREEGLSYADEYWLTSTYGVTPNHITTNRYDNSPLRPVSSVDQPGTMILVQDAAESLMEGGGDTIALFPGETSILTQWIGAGPPNRGGLSVFYNNYAFEWEWFRHDKRCNTIWLSGAVSRIPFKGYTTGIDYRYYTGDPAVAPVPQDW